MLAMPFDPSGIRLDSDSGLVRQLYQQLRGRILEGRLHPGVRLPASRHLAQVLKVSRNTVMGAYDQLLAEGFIQTRVGDGTYVAATLLSPPKSLPVTTPSTGLPTGFEGCLSTALSPDEAIKMTSNAGYTPAFRRALTSGITTTTKHPPRAFNVGIPAFDLFPFEVWSKLYSTFWRHPDMTSFGYQDPAGHAPLREMIAAYLRSSRGLNAPLIRL